jgi:beta-fructofuranosidase
MSSLAIIPLLLVMTHATAAAPLHDKTLVVWARPATLDQTGGSAVTLDDTTSHFDAIVFGELAPRKWMAGSDGFSRTHKEQTGWPAETAEDQAFTQLAVAYQGNSVTIYRNGEQYAAYQVSSQQRFGDNSVVMFGKRHLDMNGAGHFQGQIQDARIYDVALSAAQIAALRPGQPSALKPWAWWSFADGRIQERTGRFPIVKILGDVSVRDGALVLGGDHATVIASPEADGKTIETPGSWTTDQPVPAAVLQSTRALREKLLADPYRPGYHFCVPEDRGMPGDPNGAFYAHGRYHLMYLYNRSGSSFAWGHASSKDLLHWRHHPDAIGVSDGDTGCFSGGAFVDEDGTAVLSYWGLGDRRGICLASSQGPHYDHWVKSHANPVIMSTELGLTTAHDEQGKEIVYGSADPSNIWKHDGRYYMATGNLLVLNKLGRAPDAPAHEQGDRLYLFSSDDLKSWQYLHPLYESNRQWTDRSEDNMCPSLLSLPADPEGGASSGKHLLLFISHNMGCQYYTGRYEADRFLPETHGRMTWKDNAYFAPESLVDNQGRHIMWAWVFDDRPEDVKQASGWTGTYGLPRSLWLGDDGTLRMRPVRELETLRQHERLHQHLTVNAGSELKLDGINDELLELEISMVPGTARQCGVKVCQSDDGAEETRIYYDATEKALLVDTTHSGLDYGRKIVEGGPLELKDGELLVLRVFVDRSIMEAYANDRQAVGRSIYPTRAGRGVALFATGGDVQVPSVKAWEIMPCNPY